MVIDQGRVTVIDPVTKEHKLKRRQRWIAFRPTAKHTQTCTLTTCSKHSKAQQEAEAKLAELLHQMDKGTYVDASTITMVEYLRDWHAKTVAPLNRPETVRVYSTMINRHVAKSSIAMKPIRRCKRSMSKASMPD